MYVFVCVVRVGVCVYSLLLSTIYPSIVRRSYLKQKINSVLPMMGPLPWRYKLCVGVPPSSTCESLTGSKGGHVCVCTPNWWPPGVVLSQLLERCPHTHKWHVGLLPNSASLFSCTCLSGTVNWFLWVKCHLYQVISGSVEKFFQFNKEIHTLFDTGN